MMDSTDQDTIDEITLYAAHGIFDNANLQVKRYKEMRAKFAATRPDTGLAQAGGFGPEIIADIQSIAVSALNCAELWWKQNSGNVEAGLLVAAILKVLKEKPPGASRGGMSDEERAVVIKRVAEQTSVVVASKWSGKAEEVAPTSQT